MGSGSGIPTPLLLLVLSALHPIIGTIPAPVLLLAGREPGGIRLRCLSQRDFPDVLLLWSDGNGRNLTGTAENPGNSAGNSAGSSLLLRPGAGNAASCRALDPRLRTGSESSVIIADVFFPATSPWLPALVLLLVLALCLVLAAAHRLRRNRRVLAQERKAQREIQEEIEELKMELEEEMGKFQKENREMEQKLGRIQAQLEFRRAQSHAVSLSLDEQRLPPSLQIRGGSRLLPADPGSRPHAGAVAVAREGFSRGKHYWEVELGRGSGWVLGVLGEESRERLRGLIPEGTGRSRGEFSSILEGTERPRGEFSSSIPEGTGHSRGEFSSSIPEGPECSRGEFSSSIPEGPECSRGEFSSSIPEGPECSRGEFSSSIPEGTECSRGEFSSSILEGTECSREEFSSSIPEEFPLSIPGDQAPGLEYSRGEFRLPGGELLGGNSRRCRLLGVFLDRECRRLSFFDAEERRRLGSVPLELSGNLFPFFGLGAAGEELGIRPVRG